MFLGLNTNRMGILFRAQRGIALHIWTKFSFVTKKILTFFDAKLGFVSIKIPH